MMYSGESYSSPVKDQYRNGDSYALRSTNNQGVFSPSAQNYGREATFSPNH